MMRTSKRGAVSAYVLLVFGVLLTLSLAIANYGTQSLRRIRQDRKSMLAEQAAFAALDDMTGKAYWELSQSNSNGKFAAETASFDSDVNAFATGATTKAWVTPTADKIAYITANATYSGITRSVRSYIKEKDVGIWNNAIFAGSGASGQAINGNVDIRGSMHILGDGEPYLDLYGLGHYFSGDPYTDANHNGHWDPGEPYTDLLGTGQYAPPDPFNDVNKNGVYDPPMTQTSLDSSFSGTAYIGNNYSGIPSNLQSDIPAIPTVGGVATLGAEVRVKHGMIGINGNASIGTSNVIDGGSSKSTVDGMYVNDGYGGNKGASAVFSDNGTTNTYDLNNLGITFPIITGIGAQTYTDKSGTNWSTQQNYLDNRSLTVPVSNIQANSAAFSYGPDAYGNSISFSPGSPGVLTVNGIIKIAGDLQLGGNGSNLVYQGSGTFYSSGSIYVDGNLLPASGKVFPTTARLGLIAASNLNLATGAGSSQLTMAGAFYAQGTIKSAKQNQIAGTFVASYYDMGTNVPNIYQVPSLPYNMPPGMPGDKHYISFKVQTFRDRSPLPGQTDSFNGGSPFTGGTGGGTTGGSIGTS